MTYMVRQKTISKMSFAISICKSESPVSKNKDKVGSAPLLCLVPDIVCFRANGGRSQFHEWSSTIARSVTHHQDCLSISPLRNGPNLSNTALNVIANVSVLCSSNDVMYGGN